jgi:uncharacterized membrane protein YbhN (UPF0104 family)
MDKRKLLRAILNIVIIAGLLLAGYRYLNAEEVVLALQSFDYSYLVWMLGLSALYIYIKAYRFVLLMKPVSRLPAKVVLNGYVAGTAATLLPGGVTVRAALMKQAGVPVSRSSVPVFFSSLLDQFVLVSGAIVAGLFYPEVRQVALVILAGAGAAALLLAVGPIRRGLGGVLDNLAGRFRFVEHWRNFQMSLRQVFTLPTMLAALAATYLGLLVNVLILHLTLLAFEQAVSLAVLFLAFIVPSFLGRNIGTPGGVGVTEAGMVGFFTSVGIDPELSAAATAIFRIVIVLFQAALGALVYFFFWKGGRTMQPAVDEDKDHAREPHI